MTLRKLFFTSLLLMAPVVWAGPDLNGLGFAQYQKGNYKKAHELFQKALESDPKNAYAWLNLARTTVLLQGKKEPEEYCEYASNWIYVALDRLTRAMELNAKEVRAKIEEDAKGLVNLKKRPEYKKWWTAATTSAGALSDEELTRFIQAYPTWSNLSGVPHSLEFSKGVKAGPSADELSPVGDSWRARSGSIEVLSQGKVIRRYTLTRSLYHFDEGTKSFWILRLEPQGSDDDRAWDMDPVTGDCG